jgi:hypothetical protein
MPSDLRPSIQLQGALRTEALKHILHVLIPSIIFKMASYLMTATYEYFPGMRIPLLSQYSFLQKYKDNCALHGNVIIDWLGMCCRLRETPVQDMSTKRYRTL